MKYTMTPAEFTAWAAAVFGQYLPAMRLEVERWLSDKSGHFIAGLREVALREHPSVYGKPPGVAELEAMKVRAYSEGHALEAKQIGAQEHKALPVVEGGEEMFAAARKQLGWEE